MVDFEVYNANEFIIDIRLLIGERQTFLSYVEVPLEKLYKHEFLRRDYADQKKIEDYRNIVTNFLVDYINFDEDYNSNLKRQEQLKNIPKKKKVRKK